MSNEVWSPGVIGNWSDTYTDMLTGEVIEKGAKIMLDGKEIDENDITNENVDRIQIIDDGDYDCPSYERYAPEGNIIDVNWMTKAEMLQYLIQQGAVDNY